MPETLEEAIEEIQSLYRRLHDANQKWAKAVMKADNDCKSLKGQLELAVLEAAGWEAEAKKLQQQLKDLKESGG